MIISDEVEDASAKAHQARADQLRVEEEAGESSSAVPTDVPPPYTPQLPETSYLLPKHLRKCRRKVRKRFVKAIFLSCFIFLLAWALVVSFFLFWTMRRSERDREHHPVGNAPSELGRCLSVSEWDGIIEPFPSDGRYYSNLAYTIPVESGGILLHSPPEFVTGQVEVLSPKNYLGPRVQVQIRAAHRSMDILKHLYSCVNKLPDKSTVNTIYIAPFEDAESPQEDILIDIGVSLPNKSFYGNITHFSNIETNMPRVKHIIRKLTENEFVRYGSASFVTRESPVIVEGLNADKVYIRTDRGAIDAVINATSSVQLHAPDGRISAALNMTRSAQRNSTIAMTSTRGAIRSTVQLHDASTLSTSGTFKLIARGSQASTDIAVTKAPPSSTLMLDVFVAKGPLSVSLPTTFEGVFAVRSERPRLQVRRQVPDPLGHNRTRQVGWANNGTVGPKGTVWWVPQEGEPRGDVNLSAPGGSATLVL